MSELIDTTEMYLRTIMELSEEGIEPLRARIVERLHQSGPTVSQTVARLERDGLLTVRNDRHIELSETGWARARAVMRKHRLAERMLADIIGMDYVVIHEEACKLEHVMGDALEQRLAVLLEETSWSPYGCPIPPAEGELHPESFRDDVVSLEERVGDSPKKFLVKRLSEFVQADSEALPALVEIGLKPGVEIEALSGGGGVELRGPEGRVRVDLQVATGIWVAK